MSDNLKEKGQQMHVRYLDRSGRWRLKRGKLYPDNTVRYKDKSWNYNHEGVTWIPTVMNQMGFSKGLNPCVIALEEDNRIYVFRNGQKDMNGNPIRTMRQDSSFNQSEFQKLRLAKDMVQSTRDETRAPWQEKATMYAVIGIGIIALCAIVITLVMAGVIGEGFFTQPVGHK